MLDHPFSSALSLLLLPRSSSLPTMQHLLPTYHETSKRLCPYETDSRVEPPKFPEFKFKPRQVNYSSQIKPRTTWFLTLFITSFLSWAKWQSHCLTGLAFGSRCSSCSINSLGTPGMSGSFHADMSLFSRRNLMSVSSYLASRQLPI
jgi:hypothetical protein